MILKITYDIPKSESNTGGLKHEYIEVNHIEIFDCDSTPGSVFTLIVDGKSFEDDRDVGTCGVNRLDIIDGGTVIESYDRFTFKKKSNNALFSVNKNIEKELDKMEFKNKGVC